MCRFSPIFSVPLIGPLNSSVPVGECFLHRLYIGKRRRPTRQRAGVGWPFALGRRPCGWTSPGNEDGARQELLRSWGQGPLLVNYVGHGSVEIWRGLLSSDDADDLINGTQLPFVVSMTCLNGFFHDPSEESLAEALLGAKGGAIAVWASSGLTEANKQKAMNQELFRLLFHGPSLTLGEAAAKAKAAVSDMDIRKTWILFGDPTTRLRQ